MKILEVRGLTFGYEDNLVLKDLNLYVNENEIVLLDGDNAVGKTTLLKCITGIINNGKNVYINGMEVFDRKNLLKNISFVMSEDTLYDYLTLNENIEFFKMLFREDENFTKKVKILCKQLNIDKYENFLVKKLSQGTRNKLYLSIMLSKKFNILILDEPFTALDKDTQEFMIEKIKQISDEKQKAVLMVTHIEEFKKISTRKIRLEKLVF
ncbi:MAG: ABC transporter ATP-binding protein [Parvimonas sp.]|uniref:ATP-binding cassette domain-containing protein n=1 Tax=Parvimonas sp. TaxID=1944660 RepID=UPI0025EA02FF|nr:ABC transporter ATP-binding protein [Parvimonas sp.]MCI5997083.1 ABC transporter ATP-binding protein [Parvimonas sp.]